MKPYNIALYNINTVLSTFFISRQCHTAVSSVLTQQTFTLYYRTSLSTPKFHAIWLYSVSRHLAAGSLIRHQSHSYQHWLLSCTSSSIKSMQWSQLPSSVLAHSWSLFRQGLYPWCDSPPCSMSRTCHPCSLVLSLDVFPHWPGLAFPLRCVDSQCCSTELLFLRSTDLVPGVHLLCWSNCAVRIWLCWVILSLDPCSLTPDVFLPWPPWV